MISASVWEADTQNRAREAIIGVAGYPTTTTAIPRALHSLEKALKMMSQIV